MNPEWIVEQIDREFVACESVGFCYRTRKCYFLYRFFRSKQITVLTEPLDDLESKDDPYKLLASTIVTRYFCFPTSVSSAVSNTAFEVAYREIIQIHPFRRCWKHLVPLYMPQIRSMHRL